VAGQERAPSSSSNSRKSTDGAFRWDGRWCVTNRIGLFISRGASESRRERLRSTPPSFPFGARIEASISSLGQTYSIHTRIAFVCTILGSVSSRGEELGYRRWWMGKEPFATWLGLVLTKATEPPLTLFINLFSTARGTPKLES
jgi:hypothetical protein